MSSRFDLYFGMECQKTKPTKPIKPNSNISDIVSIFAKVCKFKSIGVFSSEIPNLSHFHHKPICNEVPLSEEMRSYDLKVHPQTTEIPTKEDDAMTKKIFDAVSSLKSAYLQLQLAHIPYDPQKIIAADDQVVTELEKLCKFKRESNKKKKKKNQYKKAQFLLQSEIDTNEALLGKLKSEKAARDSEILRLKQELMDLEMRNKNLTEKASSILSVAKFHDVFFKACSKSIHDFAKPLITLMKVSGWDLDRAASSIENSAVYSRRCDKKYAFEAYISRRMFHGMDLRSYDVDGVMKFDDPMDALMENPGSDFAKFCQAKYLLVVHPKMEVSFFGNLDHRTFILSGKHPRTEFYHLFAKMAKWVWVLLGSAVSIDPEATLYSVNRGSRFSSLYMESVESATLLADEGIGNYRVQFMIMPGFKIGQTLVKSQVYI